MPDPASTETSALNRFDNDIADPAAYADDAHIGSIFKELRAHDPLHWTQPDGFRPFWTVTKHADVMEIERQNELFHNEPRATLLSIEAEQDLCAIWGGPDPNTGRVSPFRTLIDMDNPDHRAFRGITQSWFMPPNLKKLNAKMAELSKRFVDKMEARNGECDFALDVAVWYPLHVIMSILGVPEEDEPLMLKLTQELFGGNDPDLKRDAADIDSNVILDFFNYFNKLTAARRAQPTDDLASVIANATLDGKPLGDLETASYYIIVATAGHDTTSSTIAGGLWTLLKNPDQWAKLQADPALLPGAIDEMIRWITPVQHFMRTAMDDCEIRGKQIKKGDHLLLSYLSANRDEDAFEDPDKFNIERKPNRHMAFGYGAHLCLGQHLAKMEARAFFSELLSRTETIEIAGDVKKVESVFVTGLKQFPIRYKFKSAA